MKKIIYIFLLLFFPINLFSENLEYINIQNFDTVKDRYYKYTTRISKILIDSEDKFTIYRYGCFNKILSNNLYEDFSQTNKYSFLIDEDNYFAFKDSNYLYFFKGEVLTRENTVSNSNKIINNIYCNNSNPEGKTFKISDDNYLYYLDDESEWHKCGYVNLFNENSNLVFYTNSSDYFITDYIGFFSSDGKQLFIGIGDRFIEKTKTEGLYTYNYPNLKRNSINLNNITFDLTVTDLLLFYPNCRFEKNGSNKDYIIDNFMDFDTITLQFSDNELSCFYLTLEEKEPSNLNSNIPTIVQKQIKELTEKYGIPEIAEESHNSLGFDKFTRKYYWSGEIGIEITYEYYYREKYGILNPRCEILYTLDVFDLYYIK